MTNDYSASEKAKSALQARVTSLEAVSALIHILNSQSLIVSSSVAQDLRTSSRTSSNSVELDSLRSALRSKEAEHRALQDERGDILRGVAGLQADMNRVRQEAISLGLDLAGVRRERDEFAKGRAEEKVAQR